MGGSKMKLLTKEIEKRLIKNYEVNKDKAETVEHKVVLKLFNPTGIGTWYLTEYNPETKIAFGLSCLHEKELGYVSLNEIQDFKGRFGLGIERDIMFQSNKLSLEECRNL